MDERTGALIANMIRGGLEGYSQKRAQQNEMRMLLEQELMKGRIKNQIDRESRIQAGQDFGFTFPGSSGPTAMPGMEPGQPGGANIGQNLPMGRPTVSGISATGAPTFKFPTPEETRAPRAASASSYMGKALSRGATLGGPAGGSAGGTVGMVRPQRFSSPGEQTQISNATKTGLSIFKQTTEPRFASAEYARIMGSKEGERDYKLASDLAFGKMTPQFFRTIVGYGTKGIATRRAIYEKATQINPEFNETQFEIGQYGTKQGISALQRQAALTGSFEKTAVLNADRALAQSEKISRSKYPMLNNLNQLWTMNVYQDPSIAPELGAFIDANKTFATEYAKVTTGQTGGAAVSDSARKEFDALLRTIDNKDVYRRRVQQMKAEMSGRIAGFERQLDELMVGLPGGQAGPRSLIPSNQATNTQDNFSVGQTYVKGGTTYTYLGNGKWKY